MVLCCVKHVCCLILMLLCSVSGTTLTITPSQVQIGGANPTALNGTCSPPTGTTAVYTITIGRKRHDALPGDKGLDMVAISTGVNNDEPEIIDGTLRSRLTVQGDIKYTSKFLQFSLSDPTCNDLKEYSFHCRTLFVPATAGNSETFHNVTYRVNPDNIRMVVFPSYETYDPGTLVTFTCTGLIGSDFPTDQSQFWVWEWRDVSQVIPTSWVRYPYSNITYGNPTAAANCNNNGRSELRHTVTELDDGRQFRCYVVNPELYSGNATIFTEEYTTTDSPLDEKTTSGDSGDGDDSPFCLLTSEDDTDDLTIGNTLTLKAAIKVKPCTTTIKYSLLCGSLMVTEFEEIDGLFYATFEVKPDYLNKQLHLQYICNNIAATIRTEGVTILTEGGTSSTILGLAIGFPVGIIVLATVLGILFAWQLKRRKPPSNETPLYDVPNQDTDTGNRYQELILNEDTRPQGQEIQNVPDVEYETPKLNQMTQNVSSDQYENIDKS